MRRVTDFVLDPMVYGLACAGLFILAGSAFPQYTKYVVILVTLWGIGLGLAAANQHGKTDPPEPEDNRPS